MTVCVRDRQTPLHQAALFDRTEIAALLLAQGADADARDECASVFELVILLPGGAEGNARYGIIAT